MIWLIAAFLALLILFIIIPVWPKELKDEAPVFIPTPPLGYDSKGQIVYRPTKGSRFDRLA